MNRVVKNTCKLLIIFVFLSGINYPISSYEATAKELTSKEMIKKKKEVDLKVKELDDEITVLREELKKNVKEFKETQSDIEMLKYDIEELEDNIESREELIESRLIAYQEKDSNMGPYVSAILEAKSLVNIFSRAFSVKTIIDADRELLARQEKDKAAVEKEEEELKNKQIALQRKFQEMQEQEKNLEVRIAENKAASLKLKESIATKKEKEKLEKERLKQEKKAKRLRELAEQEFIKQKKAAEEEAARIAVENARKEEERKAAEKAKKIAAEKRAAERKAKEAAEEAAKKAAEQQAADEAEKLAAEEAARVAREAEEQAEKETKTAEKKAQKATQKVADAEEESTAVGQGGTAGNGSNGGKVTDAGQTAPTVNGNKQAQKVIAEASKYLGTSYVWGGSNPRTGFDCSGLTQWSFKKAGVSIPRTAARQYLAAKKIKASNAKAGDLVFFSYGSGVAHVGIYLGNGKMLNSQNNGVVIESLSWWNKYLVGYGRF